MYSFGGVDSTIVETVACIEVVDKEKVESLIESQFSYRTTYRRNCIKRNHENSQNIPAMSMPITAAPVHVLMCNHNYTDFKATDSDKYRVPEIRHLRFFVVILDI